MEQQMVLRHKELLRRRGLNPKDYVVVKELYSVVWFRNLRTGAIKIVNKNN